MILDTSDSKVDSTRQTEETAAGEPSTSKGSSALVGYAAIDGDNSWLVPLAEYLSCDTSGGTSGNFALDLFGLNN